MPKEPETVDRFRITAEVAPAELGPMLATFAKMGLRNIGYELVTDVLNYKKKSHDIGSYEFAKAWVDERDSFKLAELMAHFREHGRGGSSANIPLAKMVESGELRSLGNGYYQRVPLQLAPPEPKTHGSAGKAAHRLEVSGFDVIWRHVKNRTRPFRLEELRTLFKAQGRHPHSVSAAMDKMQNQKLIKRVEAGVYQVVKGAKPPKVARKVAEGTATNLKKPRHQVSNRDLIFNYANGRESFTTEDIAKLFKENGRPPKSASSLLSTLRSDGYINKDGHGNLTVVRLPPKLNGTGAHANV